MIKLLLFDVGETLLHNHVVFPHVKTALEGIARFETADGDALTTGIVSDYYLPEHLGSEPEIIALESQFREILQNAEIDRFFEPFESRVTISSRAGVYKPAREIFELAIKRSNIDAQLSECLFVTENQEHLLKCRELEMGVLRFGTGPGIEPSFSDWSDAPALVAELVSPDDGVNRESAAAAFLAARYDLHDFTAAHRGASKAFAGRASRLVQLSDPRLGDLDGVFVEVATDVEMDLAADGRIANVNSSAPDAEQVDDAVNYVTSLMKSGNVALPGTQAHGVSHQIQTDEQGRKRLARRGFSSR